MKKILMMLLVLLGLGMAACSLEGFGGGNNNKPEHKHSIVEGWKNDSANHWQLCDSCDEKINFGAHEFGEWTKVEGLDLEIRSCACGWEEQRNTTPTNKDLTVYYYNTQNWTEVAAYAWDSVETKVLGDWPGSLMIAESDGWYTITISATSLDDLKIIFNSHQAENASQTPDIELDSDYVYFYGLNTEGFASKEDAIAAYEEEQAVPVVPNTYYLRGSMNDWGTSAPLTVNGDVASIEIEILRTDEFKVACAEWSDKNFGITNGEVAVNGGNFKVEKSGLYRVSVINYGTEQETVTIELLEEFEDQVVKNDYYFRGKINAVDHWNTCDETVKFVAGETSATFEVTLAVGDEFKVAVAGAGWSPQFNANNATYEADHIGGTDNLVVKTAGRYKLEITGWGTAEEKLVITLVEASEVEPVEKVYEVEINGVKHTLVPNPDTAGEYQVLDVAVEAGQVVKVLVDGEEAAAVADAWTGNNLNAEMKIVNNATASIYVKPAANGWSVWVTGYVAPEVPDPELPEEKEEVTVYYYNSKQWNSVYSYVWDSAENKLLGAWPGSAMTAEAEGWYTIKIEAEALEGLNIIFNNNSGTQTANIALDVVNPYYYGINTTGFASKEAALEACAAEQVSPNVYYLRGDMNNWDTSKPLTVNGDVASIEVHISKGQGFKVACASWDDKWFGDANGQNLTVEKSGLYLVSIINYGSENEELKIELVKEDEDQTPVEVVYYIVGGFNGWTVADANYVMVADSENAGFYVIKNVELTANQTLKVIEVSEGTIWNGYTNFKGDTNLNVSRDNDDNIVLADAGTYNISFKPEGREIYITKVDTTGGEGGEEQPEEPVENIITLYFQNNWDWVDVKVHYWGNNVSTEWPGVAMQLLGKLDGKELYSVSFDANKYTGFIINGINPSWESGRDQTKDLSVADYLDVFAGNALYLVRDEAASNNTLGYYGFDMNNVDTHTCDFTGDWSYDKDNHWHTCSCGLTDEKVAHTMEENTCSVCGYTVPVEQPAKMITIYFQNNWLWTDVCAHYWGDNGGTEWPGVAMEKVGEVDGQELYAVEIDMNKYTHFIINGIKNDGSGNRDQTPNLVIADYEEVASYHCLYMVWNDGNSVGHFEFQHSWSDELSSDELAHYYKCVGCGEAKEKIPHTYVSGVCSECGSKEPEMTIGQITLSDPEGMTATISTNETGEQVVTYNESQGWNTFNMVVTHWDPKMTEFVVSFTATANVKICFAFDGDYDSSIGHREYAAGSKVFETLSLSEYTLGSEFTISMYMDSTVEVTEEKSITFHSFELKKPNLVGKISTSYATLTTNELGEQVATYNVSPGWGTMKMNVAGWTSDLTVFEISFTPTKDVRLCFELNGKHGGHIDFAGGETHVHTVDVSGYPLAENFTIKIYFDAEVEVTEEKSITFHSVNLKKPDLIGKITTNAAVEITTNEAGEQVISYQDSPGFEKFKMAVNGFDATTAPLFEINFTASAEMTIFYKFGDSEYWTLGHKVYAAGEHTETIDLRTLTVDTDSDGVSEAYSLPANFTISLMIDSNATVTETKILTVHSVSLVAAE